MTSKINAPKIVKLFTLLTNPPCEAFNPYMKTVFQAENAVDGTLLRRPGTESHGFR